MLPAALLALATCAIAQSPCTKGTPSQLATVAVWVRHNGSQTQFRISDEDLTDESFQRSPADRDLFPIQLPRQPGSCPVGICALRLSTSRRIKDGALLQQEDVFGVPDGFDSLHDDFYCGRAKGDCGADVPVYRFVRGRGADSVVAYSLDSAASLPGYSRDPRPLCYAWSEAGTSRRPVTGDQCLKLTKEENSQLIYSLPNTDSFPVGATATLICSPGFLSSGPTSLLCTRDGWNPSKFGPCSRPSPSSSVALSTGSSRSFGGAACTAGGTVKNGQILYSQLEIGGRLPTGTTASVLCFLGFLPTSSLSLRCENGEWIGDWPKCLEASSAHCQPMAAPPGAKIVYNPTDTPLGIGSSATLKCTAGNAIAGAMRATCGQDGWLPKTLGVCVSNRRQKRQGVPCGGVIVFNGNATYIQASTTTPFAAGTSALISCNPGFLLQGSGSSICQNGQWSPTPGTCASSGTVNSGSSGAQCFEFAAPLSGTISYSMLSTGLGTRPSGTVATLTCSLGTTVSGALSSTCSNGVWSPTNLGTCAAGSGILECNNPPAVTNGAISYSQSNPFETVKPVGTVATLTCNFGFTASGTISSTCQAGQWIPALGTCFTSSAVSTVSPGSTAGQCTFGMFPPFGASLTYSNGATFGPFPSGTTATLQCPAGIVSGAATASCSNGQWNPTSLGTCTTGASTPSGSSTCPAPTTPSGGTIAYSQFGIGTYPSGTIATLTCTTGAVSGLSSSTCQNGQFTPALGTCSGGSTGGPTCSAIFPPFGTTANYSAGGVFGPYPPGTVLTLKCSTPGNIISGPSSATCQNGQWSVSLSAATCSATSTVATGSCPAGIAVPFGGSVSYSNGAAFGPFPSGTTASLACSGAFVQGQSISTCTGGQWGTLGICSSTGTGGGSCSGAPLTPFGASVTYSNGALFGPFPSGTVATMQCPGGSVQGSSTSTCSNGGWSSFGTCSTTSPGNVQCVSAIIVPSGGTVTYSNGQMFAPFSSGAVATLQCSSGSVIGSPTATCTGGQWTTLGTCSGSGVSGQCPSGITYPLGATVSYSNNQIFAPFSSGTVATMQCTSGFVQGSPTATCTNGQWTTLGTCSTSSGTGQCTGSVMTPVGGTITYSNNAIFPPFPSGTTATLQCTSGSMSGASISTCTNGQWNAIGTCSSSPGGQCISAIPTPIGGTVAYSNGAVFAPFASGTTATLTCTMGIPIGGSSTSSCINGNWQPTSLANCSASSAAGPSCSAVSAPFGGSITYNPASIGPVYSSGSSATLQCTGGMVTGVTTTYCTNGIWQPTLGTCSSSFGQQCSFAPQTPQSGALSYSNGATFGPWPQGTTATVSCSPGLYAQGPTTSTCVNGTWTSLAISCTPTPYIGSSTLIPAVTLAPTFVGITCTPQVAPFNGNLTYSVGGLIGPYPSGTTVTVTCGFGYNINGVATSLCNNGQWVPSSLGTCVSNLSGGGSQCYSAQFATSGTINYSNGQSFGPWASGTTATLVCSAPNFFSSGASSSVCTNGVWIPSQLGSCSSNGGSSFSNCQAIPYIMNGAVTYSQLGFPPYSEGTTATLVCNLGSTLSGQSTVTCSGGGWTPFPGLGSCQTAARSPVARDSPSRFLKGCPPPRAPPFGEVSFSEMEEGGLYTVGTTAALRCTPGHTKRGASFATCRSGAFRPLLGQCEEDEAAVTTRTCLPLHRIQDGRVTYIQSSATVALETGSTALLDCDKGFALKGRPSLTCSSDGSWQPSEGLGQCTK